jgi:pre-mRNA-processing factor 17
VKLWDTETGKVVAAFNNGKVPFCVKFHPDAAKQTEFLSGNSDKRVVQWDVRTAQVVLEYEQHLGDVNTMMFCDGDRKFVSASDDKSLRVWEYGIPVPVKYIAEPHMNSMPALALHPNGKYFVAQSLDNQIVVFEAKDRFRQSPKRRFTGHVVAGYACEVSFSSDGRFLVSGDGDGRLWVWDWKTTRLCKNMPGHDRVCIGAEWHPIQPSRVLTCSWDGTIKYWD